MRSVKKSETETNVNLLKKVTHQLHMFATHANKITGNGNFGFDSGMHDS